MNAALAIDSLTLDRGYQPPAIMTELDSTSAFDVDEPDVVHHAPAFRLPNANERNATVTMTDLLFLFSDPSHALADEMGEKSKRALADMQAYRVRIEALRSYAACDGYGLDAASERDFWYFIRSEPFIRKANLVLMDNGNLRVVWKDEHGTHIGLQFLGDRMVQYVIFKRRAATGATSRVAGHDSFKGIVRQIAAFELRSIICS